MNTEVSNYIKQLYDNRIMDSDEEFELFEDAMANLADIADIKDIPMLCTAFDDRTKESEVMFGLIHLIEDFDEEKSVEYIVQGILKIMDYAYDWAMILTRRILNSENDRKVYRMVLSQLDDVYKEIIFALLDDIKNGNPEKFKEKIEEVVN